MQCPGQDLESLLGVCRDGIMGHLDDPDEIDFMLVRARLDVEPDIKQAIARYKDNIAAEHTTSAELYEIVDTYFPHITRHVNGSEGVQGKVQKAVQREVRLHLRSCDNCLEAYFEYMDMLATEFNTLYRGRPFAQLRHTHDQTRYDDIVRQDRTFLRLIP
jgi:hypothetical protein